ncbi:MAG: hypothetical protein ACXABG_11670 [Promethearchaeota archaeon]|jgi:hypothetical protein
MNESPLNYLITVTLSALFWIITAVFIGDSFSYSVFLATWSIEDFKFLYRITLAIAAFLGLINSCYWFFYGNKDSTAGNLEQAKRKWYFIFISLIIIAVLVVFVLVIILLDEGLVFGHYSILFCFISLHTFFFFWLCTFLMSPRTVKYIPLFK